MTWVKGQSGNPAGGQPGALPPRPFEAALKRAIIQEDSKRLRAMAEKVLNLAAKGEQWACVFVADRLDGKPKQVITGGNAADGDQPVAVVGAITYHIVDATNTTDRSKTPPATSRPTMAAVRRST